METLERFKELLKNMFRIDELDLNFGIFRLMKQLNKDIEKFIDKELDQLIHEKIKEHRSKEAKEIEEKLREIEENAKELGINPMQSKKYVELKEKLKQLKTEEEIMTEVYNHLLEFFSRYYDGEIVPKFYFNENQYYIPYDGSEVYLHWATRDMYYVKTFKNHKIFSFVMNGKEFSFKITNVEEIKKNNEKEDKLLFMLDDPAFEEDGNKVFIRLKKVKENDELKKLGGSRKKIQEALNERIVDEIVKKYQLGDRERVKKKLNAFERGYNKDFFIHKNLKKFLLGQLNFYIQNNILHINNILLQDSINESMLTIANVMKDIAKNIIDKLDALERIKLKLWEKKKFVLETHYVITLDKIKEYAGEEFLESIVDEILSNEKQKEEWKELFGIDVKSKNDLIESNTLNGKEWKKLPIDTKYFDEDFKWNLLNVLSKNLPDDKGIDDILDGILIKSENWQALNLLLEKYREKIQTIYIDPPFNKENEADYLYKVGYKDSTWITMLENRIRLGRELLNEKGSIFVRCDYNGNAYVRMLMNEIFGKENFRNEIVVKRGAPKAGLFLQFENLKSIGVMYDNLYWFSKKSEKVYGKFIALLKEERKGYWTSFKKIYDRPTMRYEILGINLTEGQWMWNKERAYKAVENYKDYLKISKKTGETLEEYWERTGKKLEFVRRKGNTIQYWVPPKKETLLDNNWLDIPGYSQTTGFKTENSEILLKRVIESTSNEEDLILDFFLGSGTTTAVAHKLRRKWIGVEMGEHFWTVVLPRMKKVLFYDKSGISKEKDVKEKYNSKTAGGFFKYHTLEQYEDSLENVQFIQTSIFDYINNVDEKIKYLLEEGIDTKTNEFLGVDVEKHFLNIKINILKEDGTTELKTIDLIETIIYLLGLHIQKMYKTKENYYVIKGMEGNEKVVVILRDLKNLDLIKDRKIITEKIISDQHYDKIYVNGSANIENARNIFDEIRARLW